MQTKDLWIESMRVKLTENWLSTEKGYFFLFRYPRQGHSHLLAWRLGYFCAINFHSRALSFNRGWVWGGNVVVKKSNWILTVLLVQQDLKLIVLLVLQCILDTRNCFLISQFTVHKSAALWILIKFILCMNLYAQIHSTQHSTLVVYVGRARWEMLMYSCVMFMRVWFLWEENVEWSKLSKIPFPYAVYLLRVSRHTNTCIIICYVREVMHDMEKLEGALKFMRNANTWRRWWRWVRSTQQSLTRRFFIICSTLTQSCSPLSSPTNKLMKQIERGHDT